MANKIQLSEVGWEWELDHFIRKGCALDQAIPEGSPRPLQQSSATRTTSSLALLQPKACGHRSQDLSAYSVEEVTTYLQGRRYNQLHLPSVEQRWRAEHCMVWPAPRTGLQATMQHDRCTSARTFLFSYRNFCSHVSRLPLYISIPLQVSINIKKTHNPKTKRPLRVVNINKKKMQWIVESKKEFNFNCSKLFPLVQYLQIQTSKPINKFTNRPLRAFTVLALHKVTEGHGLHFQ